MKSHLKRWFPIQYRDFYDVPRIFLARSEKGVFLFDSKFNPSKDGYEDTYEVFSMPNLTEAELGSSWNELPAKAYEVLGQIPVAQVEFDSTKRKQVNLDVLARLVR